MFRFRLYFNKAVVSAPLRQCRNIYIKPEPPLPTPTKFEIEAAVLERIYDYTKVAEDKITLYSNLEKDLLIDDRERFGLFLDVLEHFKINLPDVRFYLRNWQSGKEASDWVAATLEEEKRLTF